MTERITGCPVSWKCFVACLPGEESQQPTWPHAWHSRNSTQRVPSFRHSSHAPGVWGGGKSAAVKSCKCSHGLAMGFSFVAGGFPGNRTPQDHCSFQGGQGRMRRRLHSNCASLLSALRAQFICLRV